MGYRGVSGFFHFLDFIGNGVNFGIIKIPELLNLIRSGICEPGNFRDGDHSSRFQKLFPFP